MLRTLLVLSALLASLATVDAAAQGLTPDQEAALRAIAREEPFQWPAMTPEQSKALADKAAAQLAEHQAHFVPHGLSVDVFWTDYERTKPFRYETIGDSACWAGHYLAALALKYKVTSDADTLAHIKNTLEKYDILTRVSGRVGYIARYAGPADDAAYREYYKVYGRGEDPERPGLGKWAHQGVEPWTDLVWLGNSSRDTYDGTAFGLATTWVYVDAPDVKALVKKIVETVGERLVADEYHVIDGQGHDTRPVPSFKLCWQRLMAAVNPEKFADVEQEYYASTPKATQEGGKVYPVTFKEYFANNLNFIRVYSLCILENNVTVKAELQGVMRDMYSKLDETLNPHFAALYLDATGDANENAIATLQGQLIDMPGPPRFFKLVDHRNDPNFEKREDNPDLLKYATLARDHVHSDFLWQRSPNLSYGRTDAPYEVPGIDLFLPYWMGRKTGHIPAP
jgi:hypothetical protein